jgi:hypothetical protein
VLLDAIRPIALAGIEDFIRRPDLADRAIFLTLEPIPEDKRRPESELWAAFNADRPRILGALLDAMAMGLARLPEIQLQQLPRMADFAIWATACETALWRRDGTSWEAGTFMKAYAGNIDTAILTVLDNSPIATAVRDFMRLQTTWNGTATDLLDLLGRVAGEKATKAKSWPIDASQLSGRLRRAATFLRKVGIEITTTRRAQERTVTITSAQPGQDSHSAPAAAADANGRGTGAGSRGDGANAWGANGQGVDASVKGNQKKNKAEDADNADNAGNAGNANNAEWRPMHNPEERGASRLNDDHIRELAEDGLKAAAMELKKTGNAEHVALVVEQRFCEKLAAAGLSPDAVKGELRRIVKVFMTL